MPDETQAGATHKTTRDDLQRRLAAYQKRIEEELVKRLDDDRLPSEIAIRPTEPTHSGKGPGIRSVMDPIRHVMAAGGKRLRPVLCLLAAEAVADDTARAIPVAAGLEYLHTFTLVHDDVMDDDTLRRGQPTVHALWGAPVAITAGDGLYALAMATLLDDSQGTDPAILARIARNAAEVSFALCAGQTRDLLFEHREHVDLDEYHDMIRGKTAVLMGLSTQTGALAAGADEQDTKDLHEYGLQLGLAFQVKDDLLDLEATEEEIGKPPDSDLRAGKKTYPVVHAMHTLDEKRRERLARLLQAPEKRTTPEMVQEIRALLEEADSLSATAEHAQRLGEKAKEALHRFASRRDRPEGPMRLLEDLVDYVTLRRQ